MVIAWSGADEDCDRGSKLLKLDHPQDPPSASASASWDAGDPPSASTAMVTCSPS